MLMIFHCRGIDLIDVQFGMARIAAVRTGVHVSATRKPVCMAEVGSGSLSKRLSKRLSMRMVHSRTKLDTLPFENKVVGMLKM